MFNSYLDYSTLPLPITLTNPLPSMIIKPGDKIVCALASLNVILIVNLEPIVRII